MPSALPAQHAVPPATARAEGEADAPEGATAGGLTSPETGTAPTGRRPIFTGVLRHKHFRYVWFGAMGSNTGTWMEGVGVQWLMAQATHKPIWMGYLAVAQLGPILLLGLVGGLVADRVNRKKLLLVTQAMMMVIAGMLALASYEGWASPGTLIGLMALQGTTAAFNFAAWQVLTPRLVPREELSRAIALNGMQFNMARVVGPALAGVLMARYGATVLFVINTLSFLGVLAAIAATPDAPPQGGATGASTPWAQVREAARFVFHERGPRAVFLGLVVFSLFAAPLLRMMPLFVSEVYKLEAGSYGVMLAIMGAGAVAGGLALKLFPAWYPKHHFIPLSITAGGLSIALFSAAPTMSFAAPFLFLAGVFWLWSFTSSNAAMQLLVDDRMRGRVASICNTAIFGVMPLGSMMAGVIGELVDGSRSEAVSGIHVQLGVGLMAAALTVAGLVMLVWRTPEVDGPVTEVAVAAAKKRSLLAGVTARAHRPRGG